MSFLPGCVAERLACPAADASCRGGLGPELGLPRLRGESRLQRGPGLRKAGRVGLGGIRLCRGLSRAVFLLVA